MSEETRKSGILTKAHAVMIEVWTDDEDERHKSKKQELQSILWQVQALNIKRMKHWWFFFSGCSKQNQGLCWHAFCVVKKIYYSASCFTEMSDWTIPLYCQVVHLYLCKSLSRAHVPPWSQSPCKRQKPYSSQAWTSLSLFTNARSCGYLEEIQ